MKWDGMERRQPSEDHDLLIEINERLKGFVDKLTDHSKRINILEKGFWMFIGAFVLVEFVIKFWKQ